MNNEVDLLNELYEQKADLEMESDVLIEEINFSEFQSYLADTEKNSENIRKITKILKNIRSLSRINKQINKIKK